MTGTARLRILVEGGHVTAADVSARSKEIAARVLTTSRHVREANFTSIHPDDLELLFDGYDRLFFEGLCRLSLGQAPLRFRLSSRMTRVGGTTTRFHPRGRPNERSYEIAISATLLYQTFDDVERSVVVNGRECVHRLEALQRIMEHEIIHLIELMLWDDSRCSAARFQSIAARFFGHTDHRHRLVTPRERAAKKFGVHPGSRVRFRFDGREFLGIVNRITKRATVLVPDDQGPLFSDGRRYATYYIPLRMLAPDEG